MAEEYGDQTKQKERAVVAARRKNEKIIAVKRVEQDS